MWNSYDGTERRGWEIHALLAEHTCGQRISLSVFDLTLERYELLVFL